MVNTAWIIPTSRIVMILLSLAIMLRCIRSMLRERYDPELWA